MVKQWSRTQGSRALSTAEAKHDAVVTGAPEGLGMQSMMTESVQPKRLLWEEDAGKADILN